jgi:16S rRNA (guanine966-N2)-methyltransferase
MRIISGKFKGRNFAPLKNLPTRPTTDFAKEALFNILENKMELDSCKVLDLFAGTGNISFEFASRGCQKIVAIDNNNQCIKSINKIINELQILEIDTKIADSLLLINKKAVESFDIIFADPPFDFSFDLYKKIIDSILSNGWLAENGILVIEHSSSTKIDFMESNKIETRKYGSVSFSFFVSNQPN